VQDAEQVVRELWVRIFGSADPLDVVLADLAARDRARIAEIRHELGEGGPDDGSAAA